MKKMLFLLLASAVLLPTLALAQISTGGRSVVTDYRQSGYLGKLWLWQNEDGSLQVAGDMSKLLEQEMTTFSATPSKIKGKKKPE